MHSKFQKHGLVTGPIPPAKLKEFQNAAKKKRRGDGVDVDGRAKKSKAFWFSRYMLWHFAQLLDTEQRRVEKGEVLDGIEQLDEHEFNLCLKSSNRYYVKHPAHRRQLEKSKGVASYTDYLDGPEGAEYNGISGGEFFKWYTRPVFEHFLRNMAPMWHGPPRAVHENITEKQCMQALRETSRYLVKYDNVCSLLKPFAGPQCLPHLRDPARREANAVDALPSSRAGDGAGGSGPLGGAWSRWRRCDDCGRWRMLDGDGVEVLGTEEFVKERHEDWDWMAWLGQGRERYDAFLRKHGLAVDGRVAEDDEDEMVQGGDDEAGVEVLVVGSGDADVGSDDGSGGASISGEDTESVVSINIGQVMRELGGRSGGLNEEEEKEAAKLLRTGERHEDGIHAPAPPLCKASKPSVDVRVRFSCDMLVRRRPGGEGKDAWTATSCEDPDDFASCKDPGPEPRFLFGKNDEVWVLDGDFGDDPLDESRYLRPAVVLDVVLVDVDQRLQELARGDLEDLRGMVGALPSKEDVDKYMENPIAHRTRAGRRKKQRERDGFIHQRDLIVLKFPAWQWNGVDYPALPEVQYEAEALVDGTSLRSWTLLPQARRRFGYREKYGAKMNLRNRVGGERPELLEKAALLSLKRVQPKAPRYNVKLNLHVMAAVRAQQTMLTRMVRFHCNTCTERFPTFHPAFVPPPELNLHLLKKNVKAGCAACNLEVGKWETVPPLEESASELLLAKTYDGHCLRCVEDVRFLRKAIGEHAREEDIIAKFGFQNEMDPVFTFPADELQHLFDSATVIEAMLVALDHMQVTYVTVRSSGLQKFKKNVISFPQDTASFVKRAGLRPCHYRPGDKVNSRKGPGSDLNRPDLHHFSASEADKARFPVDENNYLVFAGTVREVLRDGTVVVDYECGGDGVEKIEHLEPRIRMPWHPKFLYGQLGLMLRRNIGQGRVLEGLEVRWGLVANLVHALCRFGMWRGELTAAPMHKHYDSRLFDMADEEELRRTSAPAGRDCRCAGDFVEAGFDVTYVGAQTDDGAPTVERGDLVTEHAFRHWMESSEFQFGSAAALWWMQLPSIEGGQATSDKSLDQETAYDLYCEIRGEVEVVDVASVLRWLLGRGAFEGLVQAMVADGLPVADVESVLLEELEDELAVADAYHRSMDSSGPVELPGDYLDEEAEVERSLEPIVHGWPSRRGEPTGIQQAGRFERAFPLEFPMGIGGPFAHRKRPVRMEEHVQHLLRLRDGRMVNGLRGHRLVHSLVNTLLVLESMVKSRQVHRIAMRRLGGRVVGGEVLTRGALRGLFASEHTKRMVVGQILSVGKDVRSTVAHWNQQQKILDCAVKTLSWRPPFVQCPVVGLADPMIGLLGKSIQVADRIGLGRIPSMWWTLNSKYNGLYDVHRFNTTDLAAAAVTSLLDSAKTARFEFVRDNPDVVATLLSVRSELIMRVVMPAIVPHDEQFPFMGMCRFETGDGGNPHFHGFAVGSGNPRLQRVRADVSNEGMRHAKSGGDEAPNSESVSEDAASFAGSGEGSRDEAEEEEEVPSDARASVPLGRGMRRLSQPQHSRPRLPDTLHPRNANVQQQSDMERKFWNFFKDLVSEWNPIMDAGGAVRSTFFEDAKPPVDGVMDAAEARCPERARVRELLDSVVAPLVAAQVGGGTVDLQPVRRLVAALVQSSARHTMHGVDDPPGHMACAIGKKGCEVCRYGFPHDMFDGSDGRVCRLCKGDKLGLWHARFRRNDRLVCSYEPHLLLANTSNIDWRVCLNLWAVVEYVTKYATKAPGKTKRFGDVLDDAVETVCKYSPLDGAGGDLLRKTLQKFFSRSIGGRDYGLFETMQLGMRLPLVWPLMETVVLNVTGHRALKTAEELAIDPDPDPAVTHDSKVDHFNNRLALWTKQAHKGGLRKENPITVQEIKDVSLYEFNWKYYVYKKRICRSNRAVALMVKPALSADCASVLSERHELYAQAAVLAYWRLMPTVERHALVREHQGLSEHAAPGESERRLWGATEFVNPFGGERFLGSHDLFLKFDGVADRSGKCVGWTFGLMEMLLDPVLAAWVPGWVVDQYDRQNAFFRGSVRWALKEKRASRAIGNKALLRLVYRRMVRRAKRKDAEDDEARSASDSGGEDGAASVGTAPSEESGGDDVEEVPRVELVEDARPDEDAVAEVEGADGGWDRVTLAQRLSAASGNMDAAVDVRAGGGAGPSVMLREDEIVNPRGFEWKSIVDLQEYGRLKVAWKEMKGTDVDTRDEDRVDRSELDAWQGFAHDIALKKAAERERKLQVPGGGKKLADFEPLRMILSGSAGTGKSRCVRAIVASTRRMMVDGGHPVEDANKSCVLGAPTGCAAFQMKHGAATAHRIFSISPFGCVKLASDKVKRLQKRFWRYRLAVLDEFSMVGRRFFGKICFRTDQILGATPEDFVRDVSFGGLDVILAGHGDQAKPIGDESIFKTGPYTGRGVNKGPDGKAAYPGLKEFSEMGRLAFREFDDVVLLRRVHRTRVGGGARGADSFLATMSAQERERYEEEGRRYMEVAQRLSDLTWTIEDHDWLSRRYIGYLRESPEGRQELEAAQEAMLLVDGQKQAQDGEDGAVDLNAAELRKVARRLGKPIASIRASHKQPDKNTGIKAEEISADDFHGGLLNRLELCEGARVLLTTNLWVEAGLMNGAMGTVRGFVWPRGGDPGSDDPKIRAPLVVIVEFDELDLGKDRAGRERSFFPSEPSRKKWVPILRHVSGAHAFENVTREQFPLVLAWALTHWKAQGMTLRRVRVRLGSRGVASIGVGYVVVTRVKHYRDLFFEQPLPPWEDFQKVRLTPEFRLRRRFDLRLHAKFSATLRKYRDCAEDLWGEEDAEIAERILVYLRAEASKQRLRMGGDVHDDVDAYLWPHEPPVIAEKVGQAVDSVVAEVDMGERRRLFVEAVGARLQSELHLPAVREALGCLIPLDMHDSYDSAKGRQKKKPGQDDGVYLNAGKWKVNVCLEQALAAGRGIKPSELEFFLHLARHFARCFRMPLAVGTSRAGELCGGDLGVDELAVKVGMMLSMNQVADLFETTSLFVLPVLWDPVGQGSQEWVLVAFRAQDASLRTAEAVEVYVWDRLGSLERAERVRERALAVFKRLRGATVECGEVTMKVPVAESPGGTSYMVLGLIFGEIARFLRMSPPDSEAREFISNLKSSLRQGFAKLRKEAERRNERGVLVFLQDQQLCRDALTWLLERPDVADLHLSGVPRAGSHGLASGATAPDGVERRLALQVLRVLTWNVSDVVNRLSVEVLEDADWKPADNMSAVLAEVRRMRPDVAVLQECNGAVPLRELETDYRLVSAVASHCGHVHLYVAREMETAVLELPDGLPVVGASVLSADRFEVNVIGAHFPAGEDAARNREMILKRVLKVLKPLSRPFVLAGDFNVREDEAMLWCRQLKLQDAWYKGNSWFPRLSKYLPPSKDGPPWARRQRFDRVFVDGVVGAHAYLAGTRRFFTNTGCEFQLSDHFAVMAMVGFAEYRSKVEKETANDRLHRMRDVEATREERLTREMYAADSERARASRQRARVQDREAAEALVRRARKEVIRRRDDIFREAFGKNSLFHVSEEGFGALGAPPRAAWSVFSVESFGRAACATDSRDGCGIGGLRRGAGGHSYVLVVLQCLLRMPLLQRLLRGHCAVCDVGREGGNCASCALWASRLAFSSQDVPELLVRRRVVSFAFDDDEEHEAAVFLLGLLRSMAARELNEERAVEWLPCDVSMDRGLERATFVEHVFGWVLETRRRCEVCGRCQAPRFQAQNVLCLELPERDDEEGSSSAVTPTELYNSFCAPRVLDGSLAVDCPSCSRRTKHTEQRRICRHPQVLAVQFQRMASASTSSRPRRPVDLEFELLWPNFPSFELHSVIYHKLFGGARGRYSAVVRCSPRRFWRFDDDTLCREVVGDVSRLCPRQIVVAFYEASLVVPAGPRAAPGDAGDPGSERASSAAVAVVSAVPGTEGLEGSIVAPPSAALGFEGPEVSTLHAGAEDVAMDDVCAGISRLRASADSPVSPSAPSPRTLRRTKSFHGSPGELRRGGMEVMRTLFEGIALSDAAADRTFVARGLPAPVGVPRGGPEESEDERDAFARTGRGRRGRRGRGAGRDSGRRGAGRGEAAGGRGGRRGAAGAAGASWSAVRPGAGGLSGIDFFRVSGSAAGGGAGRGRSAGDHLEAASLDRVGGGRGSRGDGDLSMGGTAPVRRGLVEKLLVQPLALSDLPDSMRARALPLRICVDALDEEASGVLVDGSYCVPVRTNGDGACALHAGFGRLIRREVTCVGARRLAAGAIEEFLRDVPADVLASRLGARSGRWHLVSAAFWGMALDACRRGRFAERESRLLWFALGSDVQRRVVDEERKQAEAVEKQRLSKLRFDEVARRLCAVWGVESDFLCAVARDVHGLDVSALPADVREFCDDEYSEWVSPAYEEIGGQVIVKGTAAKPELFPVEDGPANKFVALCDPRPMFDALRRSFFVSGDREVQGRIIQMLCDVPVDGGDDVITEFMELLLQDMDNINPNPTAFPGFDVLGLRAFAAAILRSEYWLGYEELLFVADLVEQVVVVLEVEDGQARYVGGSRVRPGQPMAVVAIAGGGSRAIRSHFERVVVVPDESELADAVAVDAALPDSMWLGQSGGGGARLCSCRRIALGLRLQVHPKRVARIGLKLRDLWKQSMEVLRRTA